MQASQTQNVARSSLPHAAILWTGVGLAPLAALLLLASSGTTALRGGALLAILAVTLIGLSVALRPDATRVRVSLEEMVVDEIDGLRVDVREDITTAARATHKSFSEKLQKLYENVEALRSQVDTIRDELEVSSRKAASAPAAGRA